MVIWLGYFFITILKGLFIFGMFNNFVYEQSFLFNVMNKMKKIILLHSDNTENENAKSPSNLLYGEIAINYSQGY